MVCRDNSCCFFFVCFCFCFGLFCQWINCSVCCVLLIVCAAIRRMSTERTHGGLKDQDRIFTNLYGDGDAMLAGAQKRVIPFCLGLIFVDIDTDMYVYTFTTTTNNNMNERTG